MVGGPGGIEAFNSRFQSKSITRGSSEPPWPTPSVFGASAADTLGDLRRRIDAYDKAAANDSFADTYVERTGIWGARIAAGEVSEHLYPKAKPDWNNALHEKLNPFATGAVSYEKILGLDSIKLEVGKDAYFKNYRQVLSLEGWETYKEGVRENFRGFLCPKAMHFISPKDYFKQTIFSFNIQRITEQLKDGHFMAALSRIAGPLLMGWGVISRTKENYEDSKSQGLQGQALLGKTLKAFIGQSVKSIVSWEAGTIGYAIGASALCIGGAPAVIGGILLGGILGTACYKALSRIMPDSKL